MLFLRRGRLDPTGNMEVNDRTMAVEPVESGRQSKQQRTLMGDKMQIEEGILVVGVECNFWTYS
jgi:hypothetical protein